MAHSEVTRKKTLQRLQRQQLLDTSFGEADVAREEFIENDTKETEA
jgi:hypothetical protein